jgi:hypothetical protein
MESSTTPYGFCVVQDEKGIKALAEVNRALCQNGHAANSPPIPTFMCGAADADEEEEHVRRRSGMGGGESCFIPAGTWVEGAVELVGPGTADVCWRVANRAAFDKALEVVTDTPDGTKLVSHLPFSITNIPKCPGSE